MTENAWHVPELPTTPGEPQPTAEERAAEEALARLEDRSGAFVSYTIAADFLELRELFAGSFERMRDEDWLRRSDRRPGGWTLRQALAHVDAVAEVYNSAIGAGLAGRPVRVPGLERRGDLKVVNRDAMAARAELPVAELSASFLGHLEEAARLAAPLQEAQLGRQVAVPFFGTQPTIAELFGSSLAHAGIVHGAQLALSRARPVWIYYQPGMMRRQLTRFFHMFGLAYWPERGGGLHATLGFHAEGPGGGSWTVRAHPTGGRGKIGIPRTADVSFYFASTELMCDVFTFQTQALRQLMARRLRIKGSLRLASRITSLFTAT